MKYAFWVAGALVMVLAASCSLFSPTSNQVTVDASDTSGSSCPVTVNLDGNNALVLTTGSYQTFPLVSPGSHTLNFSTGGTPCTTSSPDKCEFSNSSSNFSITFNTSSGHVYVGTVKAGANCDDLVATESGG